MNNLNQKPSDQKINRVANIQFPGQFLTLYYLWESQKNTPSFLTSHTYTYLQFLLIVLLMVEWKSCCSTSSHFLWAGFSLTATSCWASLQDVYLPGACGGVSALGSKHLMFSLAPAGGQGADGSQYARVCWFDAGSFPWWRPWGWW